MILITGLLLVIIAGLEYMHYLERKDLMNRLMAKDFNEYNYFKEKYEADVTELKEVREEAREERKAALKTIEEDIVGAVEEKPIDLKAFEEDWEEEETR